MDDCNTSVVGRLAPSPTGLLHLGNIWAFLVAWLSCRKKAGRLILRIEDIDPSRSKSSYTDALLQDLAWLGLNWDEGPDVGGPNAPYRQSARLQLYEKALSYLEHAGYLYPCFCTRKELKNLAGAPHAEDVGPMYPGTCRNLSEQERKSRKNRGARFALRFACPNKQVHVEDIVYGENIFSPQDWGGDFALRRSDGVFAYQLAVSFDDSSMGVTEIVRGRDLLFSTPRQLLLLDALDLRKPDTFLHVPLLLDSQGERLAKRHNSITIRYLREQGVNAQAIIGFLAALTGLQTDSSPLTPSALVSRFSPDLLPRSDRRLDPVLWRQFMGDIVCP